MPQVTVYVREDDLEKWKALERKSEFIHNALNPAYLSIQSKAGSPEVVAVVSPPKTVSEVVQNTITEGEKMLRDTHDALELNVLERDPYEHLIFDSIAGKVVDTETGEYADADPGMIKELKRRKQVR